MATFFTGAYSLSDSPRKPTNWAPVMSPATTRRAPYQRRITVPAAASISVMGAARARASSARMNWRK